jgi:membrane protein DedA with SNARE-associated domain
MEYLLNHIDKLPDFLVYLILGFSAFLENIFPPAPGDMIVAFGAFLVGAERLGFAGVFISTTLGSLLGFLTLFWLGGYLGRRFFIERDFFFFKKEDIIRTGKWFKKYGYFIVTFNRFFPGVRSVISIAGGIYKLNRTRVFFLALFSAALWNIIWMGIGYTLGSKWERVETELKFIFARYNFVVLSLLLVLFVYVIFKRNKQK